MLGEVLRWFFRVAFCSAAKLTFYILSVGTQYDMTHHAIIGTLRIGAAGLVAISWTSGVFATRCSQVLPGWLRHESCSLRGRHRLAVLVYVCARQALRMLLLRHTCDVRAARGFIN